MARKDTPPWLLQTRDVPPSTPLACCFQDVLEDGDTVTGIVKSGPRTGAQNKIRAKGDSCPKPAAKEILVQFY